MTDQTATDDILADLDTFYRDYCRDQLAEVVQSDKQTIEIDYRELKRARPQIADDYLANPATVEEWLMEALELHDFPLDVDWSQYSIRVVNIHDTDETAVCDVGMYRPNDIAGEFKSIRGQVAKLSPKKIRLRRIVYECQRCGARMTIPQPDDERQEPHECKSCERQGPFRIDLEESQQYGVDHQMVRLQVLPEKAENFRSNTIDINLESDLVNSVAPGDRVAMNATAEMRLVNDDSNDVELYGEAHSIDYLDSSYDDIDVEPHRDRIKEISAANPLEKIAQSIAPEHYGDKSVKKALALQLFSSPDLDIPGGGKKRGSIHIFLVGDPGTDKSGLLKRMKELSPRSVFTTGSGSTKAGLTASAVQDDFGDAAWTIKAGALVEAHEGLCAIDELDDMDEEDRAGLLEAMSDQEINVAKAGMNPTLPANTTILAAANPVHGRFDMYQPVGEQIDVDPALLSRFDLIYTMTDQIDPETDRELAAHINETNQAAQRHTSAGRTTEIDDYQGPIEDEVLRAYVAAAQDTIPYLSDEADKKIVNSYVNIRSANDDDGPMPTTARMVDALNRLSAAHARMRLSDTIEPRDVDVAYELVMEYLNEVGIDPETGEFDTDVVETGTSKSQRDRVKTIRAIIRSEEEEHRQGVPLETIKEFAADMDVEVDKVEHAIENLKQKGQIYEPQTDHYFTNS